MTLEQTLKRNADLQRELNALRIKYNELKKKNEEMAKKLRTYKNK